MRCFLPGMDDTNPGPTLNVSIRAVTNCGSLVKTSSQPEYARRVMLGVSVLDRDVLELTRRLRASGFLDTKEALKLAYDSSRGVLALTVPDRGHDSLVS